jgi:predicted MPP superfamily phosphohydrolase
MLVAPLIFFALGTLVVRIGPKKKNVELHFPNLPASFEGFRILHVTDLHIGQNLSMNFVEKLVQKAQTVENVDIAVYTGDILDGLASRHEKEVQLLKNIPSKYGHFYIPGNHEYYWKIDDTIAPFKRAGFRILMNQTEDIKINADVLQVSGIPDPASHMFNLPGPDLEKLKPTLKPGAFHLFLAHQPNIAPQAAEAGFDLQLSGHTHGGQFFPWNFLIGFFQTYAKGLYRIQNMQLYVNQGTGYWGPSLRLGTYCELTVITLKKST